jgi:hypothetical protein
LRKASERLRRGGGGGGRRGKGRGLRGSFWWEWATVPLSAEERWVE